MSPYDPGESQATLLGDRDPIVVLQATPTRLAELAESLGEDGLELPYGQGKWRRREVIAHMADVELATSFRLRQTVADPGSTYVTYDQDVWAQHYGRLSAALALEAFRALRAWNLAWLSTLSLQDWLAEGMHPERGPMDVDRLVRFLAAHDLNHLEQLERR